MSTPIELGRPVSGDVVDLILEDHRRFEQLLRQLRDSSSDRDACEDEQESTFKRQYC